MDSIRRKKHKWQAVIRRAGEPTISKSFISKTDARKWAIGIEQKLDQGACGVNEAHPFVERAHRTSNYARSCLLAAIFPVRLKTSALINMKNSPT